MKTKKIALCMTAFLASVFMWIGLASTQIFAAEAKPSNMLNNCEPYFLSNTTVEDSFVMAGTTYTNGLKCRVAYDRTTQIHFNVGGNYSSVSFEVGHIDGTASGSSDIVMTVLAEEDQVLEEVSMTNTDIPKSITIPLTDVKQLSIKWNCRYYDSYFGIGAIHFVGSQPSVRVKESNMVNNNEPYTMSNTTIEDSFNMGNTTYTGGLKCRVAYDRTTQAHFNFGGNYESMSFEVGHIDGLGSGSSDIVMTIMKEGDQIIEEIALSNTALPRLVEVPLTGVHQLSIKWSCRYYDSYFGIGAIHLKSNGVVRDITLDKQSLQLTKGNPSAYLQAFIVPADADNLEIIWKSSNPEIASVDANGLVRGISRGTAEITATTVSGNYTASCIVDVDLPGNLENASVTLSQNSYTYTGSAIEPNVKVTYAGKTLNEGTDYAVSYLNNISAGTAQVTITGKNAYEGTARKTFSINKASQKILISKKSYTLTAGSGTVSIGAQAKTNISYILKETSIAKVNSSGKITPVKAGKTTITLTASEGTNYKAASATVTITVIPKKVTMLKPKSTSSKTVKVTWKKDKNVNGYEIQYSLKKNFSSKTLVKVNKKNTTSVKIKKLRKNSTYYFRIRSFATTPSGKIYSKYSKAQAVKIK